MTRYLSQFPQTGLNLGNAVYKASAYTAFANDCVFADSNGGIITITLPAAPIHNDYVAVIDQGRFSITNNITVARNGNTIDGAAADVILNVNGVRYEFVYDSGAATWKSAWQTGGGFGDIDWKAGTETGFASIGIDDNATGERIQLQDTSVWIGSAAATSGYILGRGLDDGSLEVSGGSGGASGGANILLYGNTAGAGNQSKFEFRSNNTVELEHYSTVPGWDFIANPIITTGLLSTGVHFLKEVAAAAADVTLYGQLWVSDTTVQKLWFTDESGVDTQMGDLLANGSVPLTADWDVGPFSITAVNLTATGNVYAGNTVLTDDNQFYMGTSGATTSVLNFDADDYISFARATNTYGFYLGTELGFSLNTNTADFKSNLLKSGSHMIAESAAASPDVTGYGQIWTKNTTPQELWFTDEAGTDVQLGIPGAGDLLADGTIPLTANWPMGNFNLTGMALVDADNSNVGTKSIVADDVLTTPAEFYLGASDAITPILNFDAGDHFDYGRTANMYSWIIGSLVVMELNGVLVNFQSLPIETGGTITAGVRYLIETAAAATDKAGHGQLWVKNTTPQQLWFTDEDGTDTQLGAAGGLTPVIITGNHTAADNELLLLDSSGGAFTVTLPAGVNLNRIAAKDVGRSCGINSVTFVPAGAETIDTDVSFIVDQNEGWIDCVYDNANTNWKVASKGAPALVYGPADLVNKSFAIPLASGGSATADTPIYVTASPQVINSSAAPEWQFSASVHEKLWFGSTMPLDWDGDPATVQIELTWCSTTANTGAVTWYLRISGVTDPTMGSGNLNSFASTNSIVDLQTNLVTPSLGAVVAGENILVKIERRAAHVDDTFTGVVNLKAISVHYVAIDQLTEASAAAVDVRIALGTIGTKTKYIGVDEMYNGSAPPGALTYTPATGSNVRLPIRGFDTTTQEDLQWIWRIPENFDVSRGFSFDVDWTVPGTNTGTARWEIRVGHFSDTDVIDIAHNATGHYTEQAGHGTAYLFHRTPKTTEDEVGLFAKNELVNFRIVRRTDVDDYNADAYLIGVNLYYWTDASTED